MNERIRELAEQAGAEFYADTILVNGKDADDLMKKFAELIVQECACIAQDSGDYDGDYKSGRVWAALDILKHFGLE